MKNNNIGDILSKEKQVKQAIKNGHEFHIHGRPVRLVGKNLFVEVNTTRGRGFSQFTRQDLESIDLSGIIAKKIEEVKSLVEAGKKLLVGGFEVVIKDGDLKLYIRGLRGWANLAEEDLLAI